MPKSLNIICIYIIVNLWITSSVSFISPISFVSHPLIYLSNSVIGLRTLKNSRVISTAISTNQSIRTNAANKGVITVTTRKCVVTHFTLKLLIHVRPLKKVRTTGSFFTANVGFTVSIKVNKRFYFLKTKIVIPELKTFNTVEGICTFRHCCVCP